MENSYEPLDETLGSGRQGPPWENPDAGDLFQRLWQTILLGIKEPAELFENMRISGGLLQPLFFYAIIVGLALIISLLLELPFQLLLGTSAGEQFIGLIIFLVLLPILLPIGLFISAGLTHLALTLLGTANQSFEATFRVNAYAYGTVGWVMAVPFCGSLIGFVWGIVLEVMGIARVHQVSTGQAAAAVLIPIAVIMVLGFCLAAVFGVALVGLLSGSY